MSDDARSETTGLTESEMVLLADAMEHSSEASCWKADCAGSIPWTVARIKADAGRAAMALMDDWRYCPRCGRPPEWKGPTSPGAPCMGCGRYPADRTPGDWHPDHPDRVAARTERDARLRADRLDPQASA